ncbi:MAG: MraY family glycosyltransferase [Patescibacteria group bacterium]|nr:undecaprenyl/decaprenyl-phosphate alpha-N-acetylglucosaminyl 1-phosphate transferase [Patescibacteria group bacterium]
MEYILETIQPYLGIFPYFGLAVVIAFLLTPLIGYFAEKLGIVDLSATEAKSAEHVLLKKINKTIALRAGGLAVGFTFLILTLITVDLNKQIIAVIISVLILCIGGYIDDKKRTNQIQQLIPQVLAALIVIAAGISIDYIQNPFDTSVDLRSLVIPFNIGSAVYAFALPADILTLIWILLIIHGVNWIFGVNALGEGITFIAYLAIMFISVKLGNSVTATMAAIMAGSILGFVPFTIYPAKIISGTTGSNIYGFLIAVLSILGGVKVSIAVIVLLIPLLDMLWVMIGRINRYGVTNIFQTIRIVTRSDHTHLHHRLLKLGLTVPQVVIVETIGVGLCAVIAFATANLPKMTTISVVGVLILLFFLILSLLIRRGVKLNKKKQHLRNRSKDPIGGDDTPEGRYAY